MQVNLSGIVSSENGGHIFFPNIFDPMTLLLEAVLLRLFLLTCC